MNKTIGIFWAAAGIVSGTAALAAPPVDVDGLPRNGALSRTLWSPDAGRQDLMGLRFSAGVAFGLRDAVQAQLGRRVAPAVSLELGPSSRLSLLPGDRGSRMLVLHTTH